MPASDEALADVIVRPRAAGARHDRGLGAATTLSSKVIGLGAPTSVRMFLELSEVPSLLDALGDELARHGCGSHIKGRDVEREADVDPAGWRYHASELQRMLGDIEHASEPRYPFDRIEVLWPTVMAHGVVHGAVRHAERRAAEAIGAAGDAAAATLGAAQQTLHDFEAVDGGGLLDVWL